METIKPKITFENVLDFKPSELIESVIADIDYVINSKIKIVMEDFFDACDCAVCLGGAKLLCMNESNLIKFKIGAIGRIRDAASYSYGVPYDTIVEIADLFDSIRIAGKNDIAYNINSIYGIEVPQVKAAIEQWNGKLFSGEITPDEIQALKDQIQSLANLLRNAGM